MPAEQPAPAKTASSNGAAESSRAASGRSEKDLVAATAGQQTVRTGLLPAPGFLKRLAKAR
jgi:hypothetical protein